MLHDATDHLNKVSVRARSHERFFLIATAFFLSHKMDYTEVNGSVHTLRFCIAAIHFYLHHRNQMDTVPILCVCDCIFCDHCSGLK